MAQSRRLKRTLEQRLTNREAQSQIAVTVTHIVNLPNVAQFSSLRCLMFMSVDFTIMSIIKAHCSFPLWQVPSICFPYPTADHPPSSALQPPSPSHTGIFAQLDHPNLVSASGHLPWPTPPCHTRSPSSSNSTPSSNSLPHPSPAEVIL